MMFKKITIIFAFIIPLLLPAGMVRAKEGTLPRPQGYVNDYANVLSDRLKVELEALSREVEDKTGVEMAIVTVKTTAPETIEEYAVRLFEAWGIGKKGRDDGIMILVATRDKKVRIEVGYGLESVITDLQSRLIINDLMIPEFKKGDYDMAVASGAAMIAKILSVEYKVNYEIDPRSKMPVSRGRKSSPLGGLLTFIFFIIIFGFRFGTLFFLTSSGGSYWSSGGRGSFGGGFGGFSGGMSGGGGASGSW